MKKIRVLLVEPMKRPKTLEVENTLEALQGLVGGDIEAVYPFDDQVVVLVNEEGKLDGLPLNRTIRNLDTLEIHDVICGNLIVVGVRICDFCSLTDELLEKYENYYYTPEKFEQYGSAILAYPLPDEEILSD